ncbi:DivIVA domain-containing protein, partial [Mycolicibacterium moriokaense]
KRGYNEDEVDAFLDRVEIELTRRLAEPGLPPPPQAGFPPQPADEQSAASAEPIHCQLFATLGKPWRAASLPTPGLAIDVGKDAIRVIDPNTNALIASASLAQVTATAENYTYVEREAGGGDGGGYGGDSCMMPVLVVTIPGVQPLTIQPRELIDSFLTSYRSRFSWRGKVPGVSEGWGDGEWAKARRPAYTVTNAEWLTLVEKFGLGTLIVDESGGRVRIELVIVLAFVVLSLVLILWAVIH